MKLKSATLAVLVFSLLSLGAKAAVTYSFLSQGSTFDDLTTANVSLTDGSTSLTMTVSSVGGNLNSNASGLGVGDANLDGITESITISFNINVEFNFIDLGGTGSALDALADGASFTINGNTVNLYTGQPNYNGTTGVYTPSSPITLTAGDTIVLTGSSSTSIFDLDGINVTAIPEPSAALLGAVGFLALRRRR
jgi:hypothetical protein